LHNPIEMFEKVVFVMVGSVSEMVGSGSVTVDSVFVMADSGPVMVGSVFVTVDSVFVMAGSGSVMVDSVSVTVGSGSVMVDSVFVMGWENSMNKDLDSEHRFAEEVVVTVESKIGRNFVIHHVYLRNVFCRENEMLGQNLCFFRKQKTEKLGREMW